MEQKAHSGTGRPAPSTVRFGAFELDLRAAELRKNGHRIRLQQQPFQILVQLLDRPGEVILREEIRKKLWPDNTVVEFDHSINAAIKRLRDSLQDSAETARYIETLPRLGYRFVAPVSWPQLGDGAPGKVVPIDVGAPASQCGIKETTNSTDLAAPRESVVGELLKSSLAPLQKIRHRWSFAAAVGVALVVIGVVLESLLPALKQAKGGAPLPAVPLTGNLGYETFPAFSPEGTRVAYSWEAPGQGGPNIYVTLIGQGDPIRLTAEPAGDFAPAWSPDGRWIAFLRAHGPSHVAIVVIPSLGGQERQLAEITLNTEEFVQQRRSHGLSPPLLAWSLDGRWLLSVDQSSSHEPHSIVRVSVETGEKRILVSPSNRRDSDGGLSVSPDGKTLAFTRTVGLFERDLYIVTLSDDMLIRTEPKRLTLDEKEIDGVAWTADGHSLVFSSDRGGRRELWQIAAVSSGQTVRITAAGDDPRYVAIARAGGHLVYSHHVANTHMWRMPLNPKNREQAHPLISSSRADGSSRYSPDGRRIAFQSNRSGHEEIWICQADGSHPVQLTALHARGGSPRWSPDGQKIAFDSNAGGRWGIYVISAQGGRPVRLTTNAANDYRPSWSQDGKWIYYSSKRVGDAQIWKIPATGGTEVQVTKSGGAVPFESADGKDLWYMKERELWKAPVRGGDERRVSASLFRASFAPAKTGVYFLEGPMSSSEATVRVQFLNFATQTIKTIAVMPAPASSEICVSPDEQWMVFVKDDRRGSELMLIENFQ